MTIFRFALSLRLRHPTIAPEEITSELRIQPRITDVKLRGSYWCSDQAKGEDEELIPAVDKWLDLLEPHATFLQQFKTTGGTIEFFVGWFTSQRSGGATLPANRLAQMGRLGIDLGLDVYAPEPAQPSEALD